MVAIAMISLNLFHPGLCFNDRRAQKFNEEKRGSAEMSDEVVMEERN
jgi:hypothetical protein